MPCSAYRKCAGVFCPAPVAPNGCRAAVPQGVALEMILSGAPIDAEAALRWGLVSHVVAGDELLDEALRIATLIAANGPLAVRAARDAVYQGAERCPWTRRSGWSSSRPNHCARARMQKKACEPLLKNANPISREKD